MLIQSELEQKLRAVFQPAHLEVLNESHLHGGAPRDSVRVRETHFKAVIVADQFSGRSMVQQHQLVYRAIGDTMANIHALGLHTFTPAEWDARGSMAPASPVCAKNGKKGHLHA
jgi:BolA protein